MGGAAKSDAFGQTSGLHRTCGHVDAEAIAQTANGHRAQCVLARRAAQPEFHGRQGARVFAAGAQAGAFSDQAKGQEHTWLSAIIYTIDATRFTGELVAGPIDTPLYEDGFVSLAFSVQVDGTPAKTQTFATAGVANAHCGDQVLNFGLVSPVANLAVNFTLELTSTTEGDGYGVPYLLGTTIGNLPPVNEVPGLQSGLAGELRATASVSIDDADAQPAGIFTTTLVITGTLARLSSYSSAGGIDTVTIETKDASSDTDTFPVNTAALPALSIAADAPSQARPDR